MAKQGNENVHLVNDFRAEKANGRIVKRFQDEYFALDLLRTLYDDTVGASAKAELLIALEEYGHLGITTESVDQIITSLLDIFQQAVDKADSSQMVCQILITCTSLIIQLDQLEAHICRSVVNELITIVTSRVNQPGSERLRSCACQSLIHLEDFCQGVLLPYYDDLTELYKRERTYVFQDYSLLTAKLMEALGSPYGGRPNAAKFTEGRFMQKQVSHEPHELRKTVADLVENVPLFTRSGSFRITQSLSTLVKQLPDISPMIFKPLMLHQMSTMSCIVFHTVLYVQHEFGGEILTGPEEADMLHRLCKMTSHPCLNQLHRLLATHWVHWYKQNVAGQAEIHESIVRKQRIIFYPSVFDSVDCQLAKLSITSLCGDTSNDTNGLETSILLGSLGCLHKMVWHTGSSQAARALFRALYFIYTRHNNESFSQDIQRFVRGLISEFAHFIPHSIDFVDSIHSLNINSNVYVETLSLLHQQVVMATEEQIHMSYPFYLLIMKKVAAQSEINQNCTLKFLDYLAQHATDIDDSSWRLGHGILDICRNIIICQGTHNYYTGMAANNTDGDGDYNGNVRVVPGSYYYVFTTPYTFYETYNEDDGDVYTNTPDHRNYSTLSFIVSATLILPALISIAQALKNLCNRKIKAFAHHHSFYMWILIACLLSCIIDILNLFDNFLNKDARLKSGHSCYYIYAFKGAMIMSVGVGLCLVSMDILLNILERGKFCFYIQERSLRLHITCFVIMCLCFVLNDLPDITGLIVHTYIHSCWEGNAYGFHAHFIGKLDLSIQLILISTMLVICGAIVCTVKVKVKRNNMVITPEFMLSALEDVDDEVINVQENARMEGESQGLSSDIADRQGDGGHNNLKDVQNLEDLMSDDTDEIHRKSYRKLPRYSSQRLRRVRIHQDNFSSESSGHENSGYMSDCCDDVMAIDYQKSSGNASTNLSDADLSALMLQTGRKRIKSDSEIQKSWKRSVMPRKYLEDHVLYVLENFFTVEPGRLVPIPKPLTRDRELSESLITNDDLTKDEDETCFIEGAASGSNSVFQDVKYENTALKHKQTENQVLQGDGNPFLVQATSMEKVSTTKPDGKISNLKDGSNLKSCSPLKSFISNNQALLAKRSNSERGILKAKTVVYRSVSLNLDQTKQSELPPELQRPAPEVTISNVEDVISVNADVHISHHDMAATDDVYSDCISDVFETPDTSDSAQKPAVKNKMALLSVSSVYSATSRMEKQVRWESDQEISGTIKKTESESESKFNNDGNNEGETSAKDDNSNEATGASAEISGKTSKSMKVVVKEETVEGACSSSEATEERPKKEISEDEITPAESAFVGDCEKNKEVLTFREYYRNHLLKPFKDVVSFMLTYTCCMVPQIMLDLYRIIRSEHNVGDDVDGVMSIVSDVCTSFLLLAMSVVFLWRFKKQRNVKKNVNVVDWRTVP